jgi:hypothetical protein
MPVDEEVKLEDPPDWSTLIAATLFGSEPVPVNWISSPLTALRWK